MEDLFVQFPWLYYVLHIWSLSWKGLALWLAARKKDKWWFVAILLLNTVGILEIFYIFAKRKYKFEFLKKLVKKKK